jgi:peroxiredoxin Q/BCP
MSPRLIPTLVLFLVMSVFSHADPLKVGDAAPQVTGVTETGATLNFGDVYRQQPFTLVYFYPKAGTSGCTAQGCSLRDAYTQLQDKGLAVIGVSTDTVETQKQFKEENHFPFTLVADHDEKVMQAFGVPNIALTHLAKRQAYLIKDGKIVWADYSASTSRQAADVLKVIGAE